MSPPRFYFPQLAKNPDLPHLRGRLESAEARHAGLVLRLKAGQVIELFDGHGRSARATVVTVARDELEFEITDQSVDSEDDGRSLQLAIALPKGDRQRMLVDAATELGVSSFIPLVTERAVAQPTDKALDRLRRQVLEACKQCGRNRLMTIEPPRSLTQLIATVEKRETSSALPMQLVAHPYDAHGELQRVTLFQILKGPPRAATIVLGPEGGLSDREVSAMSACGWQTVSLGPSILRIEVAAVAAVAQIRAWQCAPGALDT